MGRRHKLLDPFSSQKVFSQPPCNPLVVELLPLAAQLLPALRTPVSLTAFLMNHGHLRDQEFVLGGSGRRFAPAPGIVAGRFDFQHSTPRTDAHRGLVLTNKGVL